MQFREMPPFTTNQILSAKEFQHLTSARHVTLSNINHVIEWFHSSVKIAVDQQNENPFTIRCLEKTVTQLTKLWRHII